MELAKILLKFNLGNIFMEVCYKCFVAPQNTLLNGVTIVFIAAHRLSACVYMQSKSACYIQ